MAIMGKTPFKRKIQYKPERPGAVKKVLTGIAGLDEVLEGGLPRGRSTSITGAPGVGKTVFLSEFIYRGITEFDEPGVFVTCAESATDIKKNLASFGWDFQKLTDDSKLILIDLTVPAGESLSELNDNYDLSALYLRVAEAVKKIGAKRVAIDSIEALFGQLSSHSAIRFALMELIRSMRHLGVTVLVTAEENSSDDSSRKYGVEEYILDGTIRLQAYPGQQSRIRSMSVLKMRGIGYRSGTVEFEITSKGLELFPKIPFDNSVAKANYEIRKGFGLPILDQALGGGIPQGHLLLLSGETGTGKTTLAMHFAAQGIKEGQPVAWVSLEESPAQVIYCANQLGWDFEKDREKGRLQIIEQHLIDIHPDRLLYKIHDAICQGGARRIVVDSVSSLESDTMSRNKVREFMIQLTTFLKSTGSTAIVTALNHQQPNFPKGEVVSTDANEFRISSLSDGIILLQHLQTAVGFGKRLAVLKLRGSRHSHEFMPFELSDKGYEFSLPPRGK